ncbi:methionine aminopeptidase 2 [Favolaschia claudopus]|uniref:2,5-diamino-6-ribosylamino-4(3H)-pyrimidinone 5'-phosphate reductase n=1 Tax=Favolaschia claudopus TaxID=2862362 RepID=A0AAW0EIT6_9AGAR
MKTLGMVILLVLWTPMTASTPEYLNTLLAQYSTQDPPDSRPFVTLTFAQSLDGKIAGKAGKQLALSGHESLVMTHWLRTLHDAILVGSGTALNDDPQLNTRHLPPPPSGSLPHRAPRPVVLDNRLRLSLTCKLLKNYANGTGLQPSVVSSASSNDRDEEWHARRVALESAGAKVLLVPISATCPPLSAMLAVLRREGIRTLMVEGGAQIITSFFRACDSSVDRILITTAPLIVGALGVGYEVPDDNMSASFHAVETRMEGRDSVVALAPRLS